MAEVLLNNPPGVELTTGISNSDTTIHVSQVLGSLGETFRLRLGGLGGELVFVTGGAGSTSLNVTRGIEGTTQTAYGPGTLVEIAASAGAFNAVIAEAIPSSLPPSGAAGGDLAGTYPNPTLAGTPNVESIIRANRLDQFAAPTNPVSLNSEKITNLSNGTAAQDAAAFGQIPTNLPPSGAAGGDLGSTYPNPQVVATHLSSPLPVAQGGTGDVTLTAHELLLGNGTSAISQVSGTGTSGQLLTSNGAAADPSWQNAPTPVIPSAFTPLAVQVGGDITTGVASSYAEMAAASGGPGTGGLDISIPAASGDVLEITGIVSFSATNTVNVDLATMVTGSPVHWLGQSGGTSGTGIAFSPSAVVECSFTAMYTVQSGDIASGNVTWRPFYKDVIGSNHFARSVSSGPMLFGVKNLKH